MRRPCLPAGLVSAARTQRGSSMSMSANGRKNVSCATGGMVNGGKRTTVSGGPRPASTSRRKLSPLGHSRGGGMRDRSPGGAPASTQRTTASISSSLSEMSLMNSWMPMVLSRNQGGISRLSTRALIERAQGRVSSYVSSDIGAMLSGRWHSWQERCRIGAMCSANVTAASPPACWAAAGAGAQTATAAAARAHAARRSHCDLLMEVIVQSTLACT